MKVKVKVKSLSCVRLFVTPWTAAYQAPPSMGFSRQITNANEKKLQNLKIYFTCLDGQIYQIKEQHAQLNLNFR